MKIKIILVFLVTFLITFSCKKESVTVDFCESYFPLIQGKFVEYDVTYIFHDQAAGKHETTNYVLKTVVGDTVIDNSGRIARKFYRYTFDQITQEYKVKDLWTAIIDQYRAELVEENERTIKLVFAPSLEKTWNLNAFNSKNSVMATYENIHKPYYLNGENFDSTITVVEEKMQPNLIEYRRKLEIYAKNIGMIYKVYKDIEIINFDTLSPQNGIELIYRIKNYGIE